MTPVTYITYINNAQKAYDENITGLRDLAHAVDFRFSKTASEIVNKAAAFQDAQSSTPNYDELKKEFIQYTREQVAAYNTIEDTYNKGLAAIALIHFAFKYCTAYIVTPAQQEAAKHHILALGYGPKVFNEREAALSAGVARMPKDAAELTELVDRITKFLPILQSSLDSACFLVKKAEGRTTYADEWLPSLNCTFLVAESQNLRKKPTSDFPVVGQELTVISQ